MRIVRSALILPGDGAAIARAANRATALEMYWIAILAYVPTQPLGLSEAEGQILLQ